MSTCVLCSTVCAHRDVHDDLHGPRPLVARQETTAGSIVDSTHVPVGYPLLYPCEYVSSSLMWCVRVSIRVVFGEGFGWGEAEDRGWDVNVMGVGLDWEDGGSPWWRCRKPLVILPFFLLGIVLYL